MSSTKELEKNWVIKDRVYKLNSDRVSQEIYIGLTKSLGMKEKLNLQQIKRHHLLMSLKEKLD